jgi:hypothetical protein
MRVTAGRTLFCNMAGAVVAALATSGEASAHGPADAAIQDLSERVVRIEAREARAVTTASGIRLSIGGYGKTDFILDTGQAPGDTAPRATRRAGRSTR